MKTLFLSDLDGTLLNNDAIITAKTASLLNKAINSGILFTTATARTYSTVIPMFKDVNLELPLVLMNGVCIYDPVKKKTLNVKSIKPQVGAEIVSIFEKNGKYPLMYYECGGNMSIEYKKLLTESQKDYVMNRKNFYNKSFIQTDSYTLDGSKNLVYIVTLDKKENIESIYHEILKNDNVDCNFYPDNYCDEYFLEIFHKGVSKASGALEVKEMLGADKIIAFGDNMNDIALFEKADEAYAVENACNELKEIATGIIETNNDDAVARFIYDRFVKNT
ncbi:MAG: HAD family hydrolase [Acutalibacteraceae bacterium]